MLINSDSLNAITKALKGQFLPQNRQDPAQHKATRPAVLERCTPSVPSSRRPRNRHPPYYGYFVLSIKMFVLSSDRKAFLAYNLIHCLMEDLYPPAPLKLKNLRRLAPRRKFKFK